MKEEILSVPQFEQRMKTSLKKSFENSIKDFRRQTRFKYQDLIKEAAKDTRKTQFILTHEGNTIISTARLLCPATGKCEINMVYTNPKYRGQGYAMKSVKRLTQKAKGQVFLTVKKNNTSAIKCYTKAGFKIFGKEDGNEKMVFKGKNQTRKNPRTV
jgi:predicted GNAT family acetyltransferase